MNLPDVSIPMVIDGAYGVRGHDWCIRRFRTEGTVHTAEYWDLGKWVAFCYVFKEKELADCVCKLLVAGGEPDWHAFYTESQIKLYAAQEKLERFERGESEQKVAVAEFVLQCLQAGCTAYEIIAAIREGKDVPETSYEANRDAALKRIDRDWALPAPPQGKEQK